MILRALAIWLLVASFASAAWTEKYVSVAGAGAHDGTSEANAWTLAEAIAVAHADGTRINIIAGTYANTTTSRTFAEAGTTTGPIWWRGYNTTIGDIDANNALTKPAITFTTGQFAVSGAFQWFSNLNVSGASVTAGGQFFVTGGDVRVKRCRITNTAANANSAGLFVNANRAKIIACWATATSSAPAYQQGGGTGLTFWGCHAEAGSTGFELTGAGVFFCVCDSQGSHGINMTGGSDSNIINCSIYNSGGSGVSAANAGHHVLIANTIIDTTAAYGVTAVSSDANVIIHNCAIRAWTTARLNNIFESEEYGAVTEAGNPFTNAGSDDFSLIGTASSKGSGFPGAFENESFTGYPDRGAVQRQETSSGVSRSRAANQ
jgi:hypothetical protein